MKKDLTELVFILDKSGSMGGLVSDTIGGYNSMLAKQRSADGACLITTVLFADGYELLHDRTDIRAVSPITEREYQTGGSTALLDAIGRSIQKIANAQRHISEDYRAENVLFVIITDGEENSSREFSSERVKRMIEHEKKKYGWEFVFLGANIDAVETAGSLGIAPDRAADYVQDSKGTQLNFDAVSETATRFRKTGCFSAEPLQAIRDDQHRRSKNKK